MPSMIMLRTSEAPASGGVYVIVGPAGEMVPPRKASCTVIGSNCSSSKAMVLGSEVETTRTGSTDCQALMSSDSRETVKVTPSSEM